ncbi:type II secretion system F family protein [Inquilinus sp.]|jgi:tight adherence protein C|uniref:type II secretion system F family protein n=1 Tax=Inquilinus sp. TaxID=1932117 RepID=UPI003783F95B
MAIDSFETLAIAVTACSSLVLIGLGLRGTLGEVRLKRRLDSIGDRQGMAGPLSGADRLRPLERILIGGAKDREEISEQLRAAGYYDPSSVLVFAGLRLGGALLAAAVVALVLWLSGNWTEMAWLYPLGAGGVTYIGAKMGLRWRVSVRQRRVAAELPFVLDILLLMLESGVSLDQCFRSVAQTDGGGMPLVRQTVQLLVEDLQRGMAYDLALDRWRERLGVNGARELAALFKQTLLHGTELGTGLRDFVREFADKRVSTARESIGRKTTQMTIVMIVFLMPALFIVLVSPALVSLIQSLTQGN